MFLAAACLLLGDSHALATAIEINALVGSHCAVEATDGISSTAILPRAPSDLYGVTVISAGANDALNPRLSKNLEAIRDKIHAGRVVWLLPYDRGAAAAISAVAYRWGDQVIDLASSPSRPDKIHCRSYSWVARALKRAGYIAG